MVAITSAKFTFFGYIPLSNLFLGGFPSGSVVKNPLAVQETQETRVRSLGQENPLEAGMTTHSSILGWRIPWTGEPGGLQSIQSQRVRHDWSDWAHSQSFSWKKPLCLPQCFLKVFFFFLIRGKLNGPFHKSGEIECCILHCCLVAQSFPTLCNPMDCTQPHATCQAPLSTGFSRQEYRSGLPFPSPGDLPDPVIKPGSLALAGRFFTTEPPGKTWVLHQSDHWL